MTLWAARLDAILAAVGHGRGTAVLAELEALIGELKQLYGASLHSRCLLLYARVCRADVLIDDGRPAEAEAELRDVLLALTRIRHLADVRQVELVALRVMGGALCAQDLHEDAETIARAHLPRAEKQLAASFHRLLVRSLSGQGRHEEALAEAHRPFPESLPFSSGELELATAVALHALGRHDEAQAEALRALAACERYLHPTALRLGEIHALLARLASA